MEKKDGKDGKKDAFVTGSEHYGGGSCAVQSQQIMKDDILQVFVGEGRTVFETQRALIGEEEAQQLLKPLSEGGNPYTKICFRKISFGMKAARVAAPVLYSMKDQLKEVDLSDFVAGRREAETLNVMNLFSEALEGSVLKYLNLSYNILGEKGVRAFGKLLQSQTRLEELYLNKAGISEEAARAVFELLPHTDKLRVLQFHGNMMGSEGAIAISGVVKRSPGLEDFRCSSSMVHSHGGIALAEALKICTHLNKLDLSDNMFDLEAVIALSKTITLFVNLTEIYLSYLHLEDDGAVAIADALRSSAPSLQVLELAGNEITSKGASSVAACLAAKQHLVKLVLLGNELKDDGAVLISEALQNGHEEFKEIDVRATSLGMVGARVIAQSVVNKPGFKLLLINTNFIPDEGIRELKETFKKFPEKLGSLDKNDPHGQDGDDDEATGDELGSKLDVNNDVFDLEKMRGELWSVMEKGVEKLVATFAGGPKFTVEEHMAIYTAVYELCKANQDWRLQLYYKYRTTFEEYLSSTVLPSLRGKHGEFLLREFATRWSNHKRMASSMYRYFALLDRFLDYPDLDEVASLCFRGLIYENMKGEIRDAVLFLIDQERDGHEVDRALLKNAVEVFVEIGKGQMHFYVDDFEAQMLERTYTYYAQRVSKWISQADECLKVEKDRVSHYLHPSSEKKLLEMVRTGCGQRCNSSRLDSENVVQ